jgi:hypothetical protein
MKFYLSPLFIVSFLLILLSLYLLTEGRFVPPAYGNEFFALPIFFIGMTGVIVHFLFKKIIGDKILIQMLIELALILSVALLLSMS